MRKVYAIANCRVSSDEQLQNNSLNRQQASVENAAVKLEVEIIRTWSGSVSSKAGTNIKRKDLHEMLDFCRRKTRQKLELTLLQRREYQTHNADPSSSTEFFARPND